jgi:outer membrane protein OmpA-like peptidoglycan-associated protein
MRVTRSKLLLVAALAVSGRATAQSSVPLERFDPVPAGDALSSVPDPTVVGRLRLNAAARLSYARDPLLLTTKTSDGATRETTLVDHQLTAFLLISSAIGERLLLELAVPTLLSQGGESGRVGPIEFSGASGADFGDLRLGTRVALLAQQGDVPAAALGSSVWLPTGSGRYTGSERARFGAAVVAGSDYPSWLWRLSLGARQRHADPAYQGIFGSEVFASAGGAYRVANVWLGAELISATSVDAREGWLGRNTTHLEALLDVRHTIGPVALVAGGGPGLTRGAGTPAYRVFGGVDVRFDLVQRESRAGARDHREIEAVQGESRASAGRAGARRSSPPPAPSDRDHDGVPDAQDACPDVVADPFGPRPGCLPDRDGDGIADNVDHCPTVPGVASADPARHGCPPDRDDDSVPDGSDACPDEAGPKTEDPKTNGCPPAVRFVGQQIVISEQVNFATGSDTLLPESSRVLEQVAAVLREHPEIARVAVDGHTDSVGQDQANLALSRRRALSVVRWLVAHGIDERRLEARGFGARRPIADTKTAEGRSKNRRVEFQILKKTTLGERGWKDGPVDE